jgi:hypothetical protein
MEMPECMKEYDLAREEEKK